MQSNSEIRNNEKLTLTDTVANMDEYDIVFVGYPVWWHATPAPINTFLESYNLSGKLIIVLVEPLKLEAIISAFQYSLSLENFERTQIMEYQLMDM